MTQALSQVDLDLLPNKREPELADADVVARIKSKRDSYKRCVSEGIRAGTVHTQDEVAEYLKIEAGQFNRILNGSTRHLDADKENLLERVCGNKIPTQWQALQDGYELKPIKSKLEQELEQSKQREAELKRDMEILERAVKLLQK